ncbi:MAG: alpha/beta hydrolase [Pseudomonadota bacterium]
MDFIATTRAEDANGDLGPNQGVTRFLTYQDAARKRLSDTDWASAVLRAAGSNPVVIHVHGYNLTHQEALVRLRDFAAGLRAAEFAGTTVGFDWPANGATLAYRKDRADAQAIAPELVLRVIGAIPAKAQIKR